MAKLIVLYRTPEDPDHFARYFREEHMPIVETLPGLRDCEFGPVGPVGDEPQPFFWVWVGRFEDENAIQASHASPQGKAVMENIPNFTTETPTQFILP